MDRAGNRAAPEAAALWRCAFYSLLASLVLGLQPPHLARRIYYSATEHIRETELGWARWVAVRNGVALLEHGPADAASPTVCLTFDDGPHPRTCKAILAVLKREGVRATFFVVGTRSHQHPALLRRMLSEGHEIGNHTWDHLRLVTLDSEKVGREITNLQDLVERQTLIRPTLCRPPGGTYDARVLEVCRDEGMRVCLWSVNAGDWKRGKTPDQIADRVLADVHPGAIVLMHDEMPATPAALPRIIATLRERGYHFLTASEMVPAPRHPAATDVADARVHPG